MKEIKIICRSCNKTYTRPIISTSLSSQTLVLDYSVCPHCNVPRFPNLIADRDPKDLCRECGVPNNIIGNKKAARGLCWRCYRLAIRKEKNDRN